MRNRRSTLTALLTVAVFGACGGDEFQVIENTEFASSLNVDLNQMTVLESGVYIQDVVAGTGIVIQPGSQVGVLYSGYISDGTLFDQNDSTSVLAFQIGVGQVITGFDLGLIGAAAGGERRIIIPPELGYGSNQAGIIPPGSILIFDVDILTVTPP